MENLQGTTLKGYQLEFLIEEGGFGAVYRARQSSVGREVAVKIIRPKYANNPDFIRRFESEAQLVARLEHPHITPLHDFWRDPDGAYLIMRFLRGGSIREALKSGHYELELTSRLLDQIAGALDFAHRKNVIHRDIKPGNILLDEDGNGYLADFGIAKDLTGITDNQTAAGAVVGSLDYISPEQARGEPVTAKTDIYSLGVTLYEMIAGEHPFFQFSTVERLYKHISEPLPLIENLPDDTGEAINEIIQKATAKNPENRYQDVLALAIAFRTAIGRDSSTQDGNIVEQLTMREQEILSMIASGKSNRQIADELVVAVGTVKWHITQVYKKLGVRSRVQATVRARELNLIVTDDTRNDFAPTVIDSAKSISLPEPDNPYKGLHAFQITDARDFFGRNDLVEKLIERMQEPDLYQRFLAIVGPSGSGKSSLVRAGLIPAIWRGAIKDSEKWFIVDMIPGTHPLDKLETALIRVAANQASNLREQLGRDERGLLRVADIILPGDDSELLIVVDQFEEVFTLVEDETIRQQFLNLLLTAVTDTRSRVRVIVTLRADYYDRPLHYPEFGELVRSQMETILPLTAKGLERAIRGPAERVGVTFEQGLVAQIVSDMNYQSGALPLLQYALTELFDRRDGRLLSHTAYKEIGGAVGALANRADEIYRSLIDEAQELTQQLFLRLVTLGEGTEDTRRRAKHDELLSLTENTDLMEEIIDQFAAYRLLSLDNDPETRQPTVEVAHEAILREWERLRGWLNESRDDIRQERALSRATEDWDSHNRDASYLLRGNRLEQIEQWEKNTSLTLTPLEQMFIDTSILQRDAEEQERLAQEKREAEQAKRQKVLEKRAQTILRALVAVFALATLLSGGFGLYAFNRQNVATAALTDAEQSAAEFRSIALTFGAQQALDSGQPDVALALAQEAINMENPPFAAQEIFFEASNANWIRQRVFVPDARLWDGIFHPDGERIITSSWDGRTILWDIETGEELQSLQHAGFPAWLAVHPDGHLIAVSGNQGFLQLWNIETGEIHELPAGGNRQEQSAFSHDGTVLVTATNGSIDIWNLATLSITHSFEAHDASINSIHFSADDSLLSISTSDGVASIWDFNTFELLQTLDHPLRDEYPDTSIWDSQFLPDSDHVIATGYGLVWMWNWHTGEIIWLHDDPEGGGFYDVALSPDGEIFAIPKGDPISTVELRYVETGNLIRTYAGHTERVQNVDFSPDGQSIMSVGSFDSSAIVWRVNWEGTISTIPTNRPVDVAWHPSEPIIALVETSSNLDEDGVIRVLNVDTQETIHEIYAHREDHYTVNDIEFSPDGRFIVSGEADYNSPAITVYIWDMQSGEEVLAIDGHNGFAISIAISPDSQTLAIGELGGDAIIRLWDIETGEMLHELEGHRDWINSLIFSPDGRYLYSAGQVGSLFRWDVETGALIQEFTTNSINITEIDISADGTQLMYAQTTGETYVLDIENNLTLFTVSGHTDQVVDTEFSPAGDIIMASSNDGSIVIRSASSGEHLRTYVAGDETEFARSSTVLSDLRATFSPDGSQIASIRNDEVIIWDAALINNDPGIWIIENRYIPDFTCEQRALYVIEPLCEDE